VLLFGANRENVLYLPFVLVYLFTEGAQTGRYEENKWDNPYSIFFPYTLFIDGSTQYDRNEGRDWCGKPQ